MESGLTRMERDLIVPELDLVSLSQNWRGRVHQLWRLSPWPFDVTYLSCFIHP